MKTEIIAGLTLTLLISSCNVSDRKVPELDKDIKRIQIDASAIKDTVDVSDLISKISIVRLEEDGNYMTEAWKVLLSGNHYIVFDRYSCKCIKVFDKGGQLVKNIFATGDGPKEVLNINDCWINEDGLLELYDFRLRKILQLDSDYNPIKAIKCENHLFFNSIYKFDGLYIGYDGYSDLNPQFNNNSYKVARLDENFILKETTFHFDKEFRGTLISSPINPFLKINNEEVRFFQDFDPYVYNVSKSGDFEKKYHLDYFPNPLPENFEEKVIKEHLPVFKSSSSDYDARKSVFKGYNGFRGPWFETMDFVIFTSFDTEYEQFSTLYDKEAGEIIGNGRFLKESKKYNLILPFFHTVDAAENRYVSVLEGYILKLFVEGDSPFDQYLSKEEDLESYYLIEVVLDSPN
ncbi:6-bladed beta-propeller [Belliella marina]|uniref:6-bladed beta-propeller n=1 Tax=Belliella marina TaxID=1644146 RepID=A0ABW4VPQ8_9BACT